jgi:hypothetical protein
MRDIPGIRISTYIQNTGYYSNVIQISATIVSDHGDSQPQHFSGREQVSAVQACLKFYFHEFVFQH